MLENSHIIFGDIFEFMEMIAAAETAIEADEITEEARLYLWAVENCLFPIYRYYSQQETLLCDVPDQLNEENCLENIIYSLQISDRSFF